MSNGNKRYNQQQEEETRRASAQQQADRERMLQDSPQTKWLRDLATRGAAWISGKNYSSAPPGMFKFDLNDPAKRAKMREADMNLQDTGAFALGGQNANPQALAMARMRLNDQNDQDQAANYEGAVNSYMDEVKGMNADLSNYDFTRDNALLGNAFNRFSTASRNWGTSANTPSPWWGIAGSAIGAAGAIGAAH